MPYGKSLLLPPFGLVKAQLSVCTLRSWHPHLSLGCMIALSRYDTTQSESLTITSVTTNADGSTSVGVHPPLSHKHVSVVVDGHSMAAGVGLVTRGITVTGHNHQQAGWGAHVVVGQIVSNTDFFTGQLTAVGVQFVGVGKLSSEHPAILFQVGKAELCFCVWGMG